MWGWPGLGCRVCSSSQWDSKTSLAGLVEGLTPRSVSGAQRNYQHTVGAQNKCVERVLTQKA